MAVDLLRDDPEFTLLDLDDEGRQAFRADAERLVRSYFDLEDPTTVREIGLELRLEAKVGPLALRGIIDRLELDEHGGLVVTDYKTGKAPSANYEQRRLGGVQFYAFLCQEVFGRRPSAVQLLYLGSGEAIIARPTEQSVAYLPKRTAAVWRAVEKACADGDFRPRIGPLCNFCGFKQWCPAHGGDPDRALLEAPVAYAQGPVQLPLAAV
jgi:putative RecB family exonuclease